MKFLEIAGANVTLAEDQEEYETIKVRGYNMLIQHGNLAVPMPAMTAEIKPDAEDLKRLNEGGSLFLTCLGVGWPPVSLATVDPALDEPTEGNA